MSHFLKEARETQRGRDFGSSKTQEERINNAKYMLTMFSPYGSLLGDGSEEAALL
jgi:hypothetical protein